MVSLLFFGSCKNEPKTLSPQESLINWQKLVDAGLFEQAEQISTQATIDWFEEIDKTSLEEDLNTYTEFHELNCTIKNDTAICAYYLVEDREKLPFTTQLVNVKGVWMVDIHDDE